MSAPERIWANLEFGEDKCYPVETEKFGDGKFYSAEDAEEYIHTDTVDEMIRQAVTDAETKALRRAADEMEDERAKQAILALIPKELKK